MIDLYAWATPNSIKVPILLEELGPTAVKEMVRRTLTALTTSHSSA
jgi:hypothetical protein